MREIPEEYAAVLRHVDHTCLSPEATWEEIRKVTDEGIRYATASICIPPVYVADAVSYAAGRIPVCTVIGFPCGYCAPGIKAAEAEAAVRDGAAELDMVIRIGYVRDRRWAEVREEIRAVREACAGRILKVIVETCLLTGEEKIRLCALVGEAGADYIKTSTGFSRRGATREDVALLSAHCPPGLRVKASGGISDFAAAEEFLRLGADRLGTSRLVGICRDAVFGCRRNMGNSAGQKQWEAADAAGEKQEKPSE